MRETREAPPTPPRERTRARARGEARGRRVAVEGMIGAAVTIVLKIKYGATRNSGEAVSAITASLRSSFTRPRYGSQMLGGLRFCSHARHWLTQPRKMGAAASAA